MQELIQPPKPEDLGKCLIMAKEAEGVSMDGLILKNGTIYQYKLSNIYCNGKQIYLNSTRKFSCGKTLCKRPLSIFKVVGKILTTNANINVSIEHDFLVIDTDSGSIHKQYKFRVIPYV